MIAALIRLCIRQRGLVLLAAAALAVAGIWAVRSTPLDALPDLSDTQVIVRTSWPGRAPAQVEDQLTYPLTTTLLSVPAVKSVRGYSFFGDSFVYVLFEDGTDPYWARSRVLEVLSQARERLPSGVEPALGPDATGLGWIFEYALVDRSGRHDLGQLRALQDWRLRYALKTVPNVAEVASLGGMVPAWQIVVDPQALAARRLTVDQVIDAVRAANGAAGGSVIEQGEAELVVKSEGYLRTLTDFEGVPIAGQGGIPVRLADVARIQRGPALRRGVAELDGEGEVAGGVVLLRSGQDALGTIQAVKARLAQIQRELPAGVEIVTTYDRSALIRAAVSNLRQKLVEEFLVVALVCGLFLLHVRSALVAVITLPLGVLAAFVIMRVQGLTANLLTLGGIAIAVGAMVDAAVVMIENAHKHLEAFEARHGVAPVGEARWRLMANAAAEVGPALFASLLVITLSFVPVFALQAQEGRLFAPLAFTKTYAMAAAAALSVTLVPVLMGYLIRGHVRHEQANPVNRTLVRLYRPVLDRVLHAPRAAFAVALGLVLLTLVPLARLGTEFMPALDEGSLLYMPTALPGLSTQKAAQLLQTTDRQIRSVPEVAHVFGKAGRADTATDPAPMEMFETTVTFKPRDQWRPGMTPAKLRAELDAAVHVPGLTNLWVPPIRNRIDMLATGIKSPIGIRVFGTDVATLARVVPAIEAAARTVPGVRSAVAERLGGGRYVDVTVNRATAMRYGVTQRQVQALLATAVGGAPIDEALVGRERYPIVVRLPAAQRQSVGALERLPINTPAGDLIALGQIASVRVVPGPPMLRSEDARLAATVFVDVDGRSLGDVVAALQARMARDVTLPTGVSLGWSGQYEYLERALARLAWVVPIALAVIALLIYAVFRRVAETLIILTTLPFALIGGVWLIAALGHQVSVATVIGFIALAGVAAEFGVIMLLYLQQAWQASAQRDAAALDDAITEGAVHRVRPKAMTVAVILAGLFPLFIGSGAGSEVMQRIAAPMVGGMLTAPLLSMLLIPAAYRSLWRHRLAQDGAVAL